uniref:Uncharacterized protein n=1 Tax=Anguilla anguilla TaxID=7936 RepID=A0A0E9QZM1_ANGAN
MRHLGPENQSSCNRGKIKSLKISCKTQLELRIGYKPDLPGPAHSCLASHFASLAVTDFLLR